MPPFNVRGLLPPLLAQYFRYNGSLTTPPCYQSVLWTVFHRRAQISMEQVSSGEVKRQNCNLKPFPTPQSKGCSSEPHASASQLEKLRETLFSTEEEPSEPLVQNYRAAQPLNQRMVFASFIQGDCTGLGKGDGKLGDSMAGTRMPLGRKRLTREGIPRPCLDWDPPCPQGWSRAASSWVGIWSR